MPAIIKRSLRIAGHATSISLEEPFWRFLRQKAESEGRSLSALVEEIDRDRRDGNLSSAIRVHLLEWLMTGGILAGKADPEA
ncbi:MAG: ribbon-helix-helix domain-containing protein [Rhabdaerophilum sp.]|jgi:predicted DNA-binding ribbon-helix-helix protein